MRGRVAMATAVSRGRTVVAGVLVLAIVQVLVGAGTAAAATTDGSGMVVSDAMDVGLAGGVGVVAILVGAVGMVYGLTRRHRQSLARRAAERAASVETP
jgi:hypothetical protein